MSDIPGSVTAHTAHEWAFEQIKQNCDRAINDAEAQTWDKALLVIRKRMRKLDEVRSTDTDASICWNELRILKNTLIDLANGVERE